MTGPGGRTTGEQLGIVARGGALNLLGAVVASVGSFGLVWVVANGVDADAAGELFAAVSVLLILGALAALGTDTGLARFLLRFEAVGRRDDVPAVLRTVTTWVGVASVATAVALGLAAGALAPALGFDAGGVAVLRIVAAAVPLAAATEVALGVSRAVGHMRPTVLVDNVGRTAGQLVSVGAVTALARPAPTTTLLAAAWVAPYLPVALAAVLSARRVLRDRGDLPAPPGVVAAPGVVGEFWRYTAPRGVARLWQIALQRLDIVLVAALVGPAAAAVYTTATRVVVLGQFAAQAVQRVLQPRFADLVAREAHDVLAEVFRVATAWSMAVSWPIHVAAAAAAPLYLQLFGDGYGDAGVPVVVVVALAMMWSVAAGPLDTLLLMAGGSAASLGIMTTALVVDVAANVVLLPRLGVVGAAWAWAAAVVVRSLLTYRSVRARSAVSPFSRASLVVGAAAVGCIGVPLATVGALQSGPVGAVAVWPSLVAGLVGGAAYLGVLWAARGPLRLSSLRALARREPGAGGAPVAVGAGAGVADP